MTEFDFDGDANKKTFPKYSGITEDWYESEITAISKVITVPKFQGQQGETEEVIYFTFGVPSLDWKQYCMNKDDITEEPKTLDLIWSPKTKVTKSNNPVYSNSKMYDFLSEVNLLNGMKTISEEMKKLDDVTASNTLYTDFLTKNLVGKQFKIFIDKTNTGRPKITKVRLLGKPEVAEEKV